MVLSGVQDRLAPLQAWLFPQRVYLQLEDQAITVLVLAGHEIRWQERVPLPEGLCVNGEPTAVEALGDLIGDLLVERGFPGARVKAVLPRAATAWRVIEWPEGRWPEQPELVVRQRQEELRLPWRLDGAIEGADLQLEPLPTEPPRSLLVAVRRPLLEAWIAVCNQAGVALDAVEALPICLWRAVAPGPEPWALVLHLGAEQSWLLALDQGQPLGEWPLPGAADVTALAAALDRWHRGAELSAANNVSMPICTVAERDGLGVAEELVAQLGSLLPWQFRGPGLPVPPDLMVLWGLAAAELAP